jgi:hypothetical protein
VLAVVIALAGCSSERAAATSATSQAKPASTARSNAPIGTATMTPEGTIILDLRAEDPNGKAIGDSRFVYPRGHREYADILKHLGGLKPGESKPVPPWPEK